MSNSTSFIFNLSEPVAHDIAYMVNGVYVNDYVFTIDKKLDYPAMELAFALNNLDLEKEGYMRQVHEYYGQAPYTSETYFDLEVESGGEVVQTYRCKQAKSIRMIKKCWGGCTFKTSRVHVHHGNTDWHESVDFSNWGCNL